MNLETWIEEYKPIPNQFNEDAIYGLGFETFGQELQFVQKQNTECIWTMVDEESSIFILSGYHIVNRVVYFITEKPYSQKECQVVYII